MIKIVRLQLKMPYRIQWLRYITGVNLSEHCMKAFIGTNDLRIKGYVKGYYDIDLREGFQYYYFCAVHAGGIWEHNVHIAFREKPASRIIIDDEFVNCEIVNAERIPINNSYIDQTLPQASDKRFNTCRNWMFANMIKNTLN